MPLIKRRLNAIALCQQLTIFWCQIVNNLINIAPERGSIQFHARQNFFIHKTFKIGVNA